MKKTIPYIVLTALIFSFSLLISRSFRVSQIPNGNVGNCANCHINPAGGGAKNSFGSTVEASFLSSGNVVWGPELAALDSDGDGFTNGEELQDPEGAWQQGSSAPGDPNLVSLPGDPNSVPAITSVNDIHGFVNEYKLHNNYPNPFNPSTNISFSIAEPSEVAIRVYNSLGQFVNELTNQTYGPGTFTATWDAKSINGGKLSSGMYIYSISAKSLFTGKLFTESKRMLFIK